MSYKSFSQGDIIEIYFPEEQPKPQFTTKGHHPALLLHDHYLPNQTIILSPLSSLYDGNGDVKELKSYHLKLMKRDYPQLKNDSFVKLDQIMTFTRHKIGRLICALTEKDNAACHLKLMESLQMQDTIKEITQKQLDEAVKKVLNEYIRELTDENK